MKKIVIPKPVSAGIILSYKCNSECLHCMYACSPRWKQDWISENDLKRNLTQLADTIAPSPMGKDRVGINYGLHFTGGEPFLNFDLLLKAIEIAKKLGIPSTFVETNAFWCTSEESTKEKLIKLREQGLNGILVSVNPFILEYIPFERTQRAIQVSKEIFARNVMIYQEDFYNQFREINIRNTMSFKEYLQKMGLKGLKFIELIPMGRAVYSFYNLYERFPARKFFGKSCLDNLQREWHIHIDNYNNYITGYCGGISLGDARELNSICDGIDLEERPILESLATDIQKLYDLGVEKYGYQMLKEGYISKCHLCLDIRKHIVKQTDEFKELNPREFYFQLE